MGRQGAVPQRTPMPKSLLAAAEFGSTPDACPILITNGRWPYEEYLTAGERQRATRPSVPEQVDRAERLARRIVGHRRALQHIVGGVVADAELLALAQLEHLAPREQPGRHGTTRTRMSEKSLRSWPLASARRTIWYCSRRKPPIKYSWRPTTCRV